MTKEYKVSELGGEYYISRGENLSSLQKGLYSVSLGKEIIISPMDLETIKDKLSNYKFKTNGEFNKLLYGENLKFLLSFKGPLEIVEGKTKIGGEI